MEIRVCGFDMPMDGQTIEYELNTQGKNYNQLLKFLRMNQSLYQYAETEDELNHKSIIKIWET